LCCLGEKPVVRALKKMTADASKLLLQLATLPNCGDFLKPVKSNVLKDNQSTTKVYYR
jgi:hypothetical protein